MQLDATDWLGSEDATEFYSLFPLSDETVPKFKALLVRQMAAGRPLLLNDHVADIAVRDGGFVEGEHFLRTPVEPGSIVDKRA